MAFAQHMHRRGEERRPAQALFSVVTAVHSVCTSLDIAGSSPNPTFGHNVLGVQRYQKKAITVEDVTSKEEPFAG